MCVNLVLLVLQRVCGGHRMTFGVISLLPFGSLALNAAF